MGFMGCRAISLDRKQVEVELKKHRDQLEGLIDERTAELTKAYEYLKQENEARKAGEIGFKVQGNGTGKGPPRA